MAINRKDFASGAIFVAIGFFYLAYTLGTLPVGRAINMGPGYFPVVLSGIMMVIGTMIVIRSVVVVSQTPFGAVPWRAIVMITLSTVIFAAFFEELGIFPAVLATSMLASFSSRQIPPGRSFLVSFFLALFCWLVFKFGIGLPIAMFGRWFDKTPLREIEPWLLTAIGAIVRLPAALFHFVSTAEH